MGLALALAATAIAPAAARPRHRRATTCNVGVAAQRGDADLHRLHGRHRRRVAGRPSSPAPGEGTLSIDDGRHEHRPVGDLHADPASRGRRLVHVQRRLARAAARRHRRDRSPRRPSPADRRPARAPVCANDSQSVPQEVATNLRLVCASGGDPITTYAIATTSRPRDARHDEPRRGLVDVHVGRRVLRRGHASSTRRRARAAPRAACPTRRLRPDGAQPAAGADRPDGAPGPTGPTGATGAQGGRRAPAGPTGAVGSQGATGSPGAAGKRPARTARSSRPRS